VSTVTGTVDTRPIVEFFVVVVLPSSSVLGMLKKLHLCYSFSEGEI
jgi:hypothetical protein